MSKNKGLFFDSDEEEDVNFLRKNKNVFKDDSDNDIGGVDDEVEQFKRRRDENLQKLAQVDQDNAKKIQELKDQAQLTLAGAGAGVATSKKNTDTKKTNKGSVLFQDDEDDIDLVQQELSKTRINADNSAIKGLYVPGGALQWNDDESQKLKKQQEEQKAQTSALFGDDESDVFLTNAKTTTATKQTKGVDVVKVENVGQNKPQAKIMSSLFDDDDDEGETVTTPLTTNKTEKSADLTKIPAPSTTTGGGFSSLFDDDDNNTPYNAVGDDTIGDDFDFSAYLSSQK